MAYALYTVGHGNRRFEELISLLKDAGVDTLVDVRAQPRSRHNPQFNDDALRLACDRAGIVYHWAGRQLGGMRKIGVRDGFSDSEIQKRNNAGENPSLTPIFPPHLALDDGLRGFADHMDTDAFQKGAAQLQHLAARGVCAMLCAERDPAQCHRSLIADYLTLQGVQVVHLIAPGESRQHVLSPAARRESAALVYDRQVSGELDLESVPPGPKTTM